VYVIDHKKVCRRWIERLLPGQQLHPSTLCKSSIISGLAPVAQLDRAVASGATGREFESLRAHHSVPPIVGPVSVVRAVVVESEDRCVP
jgi:hypothetical protein